MGCPKLYNNFTDLKLSYVNNCVRLKKSKKTLRRDYMFGFNGQEKTDEIAGKGNHNTALFWEYDTRLGRRWNLDPKPTVGESEYVCFGDNPIFYTDLLGDKKKNVKPKTNQSSTPAIPNSTIPANGTTTSTVGNTVTTTSCYNGQCSTMTRIINTKPSEEELVMRGIGISDAQVKKAYEQNDPMAGGLDFANKVSWPLFKLIVLFRNPEGIVENVSYKASTAVISTVGASKIIRSVDYTKFFSNKLVQKHIIGDDPATALMHLDKGGSWQKWATHVQNLAEQGIGQINKIPTGQTMEIMGTMPREAGGNLNIGVRLFKPTNGESWELTTILTRQ